MKDHDINGFVWTSFLNNRAIIDSNKLNVAMAVKQSIS